MNTNEIIGELVGEAAEAVQVSTGPGKSSWRVGKYDLVDSPDTLKVPEAFMALVKEQGDTKPMFLTYAVPVGLSRKLSPDETNMTPNRYWPVHVIEAMVVKVRAHKVPGFKGHAMSVEQMGGLPNAALHFVAAAKGVHSESGVQAGLFKAYVYDVDDNRTYAKLGMFDYVSPSTISKQRPEVIDGQEVLYVEQANLLSLDLVRPFMQGIPGAVQVASEGASMLRKPEEIKLISELGLNDLKEHNPQLLSTLAAEVAKTTVPADNVALLEKTQKLIQENASLQMDNVIAMEVAKALGCKIDELPKHITHLLNLQKSVVSSALAVELGEIKEKPLRDAVAKQLEGSELTSVEAVKPAVEAALGVVKGIVAAFGAQFGAVGDNTRSTGTNSVASREMLDVMGVN